LNKASPVPDEVAMQYTIQRHDRVADQCLTPGFQ